MNIVFTNTKFVAPNVLLCLQIDKQEFEKIMTRSAPDLISKRKKYPCSGQVGTQVSVKPRHKHQKLLNDIQQQAFGLSDVFKLPLIVSEVFEAGGVAKGCTLEARVGESDYLRADCSLTFMKNDCDNFEWQFQCNPSFYHETCSQTPAPGEDAETDRIDFRGGFSPPCQVSLPPERRRQLNLDFPLDDEKKDKCFFSFVLPDQDLACKPTTDQEEANPETRYKLFLLARKDVKERKEAGEEVEVAEEAAMLAAEEAAMLYGEMLLSKAIQAIKDGKFCDGKITTDELCKEMQRGKQLGSGKDKDIENVLEKLASEDSVKDGKVSREDLQKFRDQTKKQFDERKLKDKIEIGKKLHKQLSDLEYAKLNDRCRRLHSKLSDDQEKDKVSDQDSTLKRHLIRSLVMGSDPTLKPLGNLLLVGGFVYFEEVGDQEYKVIGLKAITSWNKHTPELGFLPWQDVDAEVVEKLSQEGRFQGVSLTGLRYEDSAGRRIDKLTEFAWIGNTRLYLRF